MKQAGIVMGSDSDLPILRKTMDTLSELGGTLPVPHLFRPPHP